MNTTDKNLLDDVPPRTMAQIRMALAELTEAAEYARKLQIDSWQLAIEIRCLRRLGLTHGDLRWLISRGLIEHRLERTRAVDPHRAFRCAFNLAFTKHSCFTATCEGLSLARQTLASRQDNRLAKAPTTKATSAAEVQEIPSWDAESHTLYWRGSAVKHFRHDAANQEAVLTAFHASGWARCIHFAQKRDAQISAKKRLRDTIKNLNRNVAPFLRFRQEGSGDRVLWEARAELPQ
jgi:hypothetical protein